MVLAASVVPTAGSEPQTVTVAQPAVTPAGPARRGRIRARRGWRDSVVPRTCDSELARDSVDPGAGQGTVKLRPAAAPEPGAPGPALPVALVTGP